MRGIVFTDGHQSQTFESFGTVRGILRLKRINVCHLEGQPVEGNISPRIVKKKKNSPQVSVFISVSHNRAAAAR